MIRMKVYKLSQVICAAILFVLLLAAIILGVTMCSGKDKAEDASVTTTMAQTASAQTAGASAEADKPKTDLSAYLSPEKLLKDQLPLQPEVKPVTAEAEEGDVPDDVERIRVEISKIQGEYEPAPDVDKPRVLIYHTHSYEAYAQDENNPYKETTQWRTKDTSYNIMGVGEKLTQELEALGIEVVHDETAYEPPKLGTAYIRSLEALEARAEAGEEYDMMIDLHRDEASARNTNPSTVNVDGKDCARLMVLIGTGEGSNGNSFRIKPNWQENYKLAEAITNGLNACQDGLARDIMVKTGRYNQHMSTGAVLIEVGHNKNTLQEAMNATVPLAKVIAAILLNS